MWLCARICFALMIVMWIVATSFPGTAFGAGMGVISFGFFVAALMFALSQLGECPMVKK